MTLSIRRLPRHGGFEILYDRGIRFLDDWHQADPFLSVSTLARVFEFL
jgi:hypothetical protein